MDVGQRMTVNGVVTGGRIMGTAREPRTRRILGWWMSVDLECKRERRLGRLTSELSRKGIATSGAKSASLGSARLVTGPFVGCSVLLDRPWAGTLCEPRQYVWLVHRLTGWPRPAVLRWHLCLRV